MGCMSRKQIVFVLRRGEDLPEEIAARENLLRVVGDDIGTFPSDVRIQCSVVDYAIEKIVDRLRDDPVLKRMRQWAAQYLALMGKLTPRQRTFVYWRYRRGLSVKDTATAMRVHPQKVKEMGARVLKRLEDAGFETF